MNAGHRKHLSAIVVCIALICMTTFAAEKKEPAARLSVTDAIKLIPDADSLAKDRAKRDRVVAAFKGLNAAEARATIPKLLPLLETVRGSSQWALARAFQELGDPAIQPLADALTNDKWADNAARTLMQFRDKGIAALAPRVDHKQTKVRLRALAALQRMAVYPYRLAGSREMVLAVPRVAERLADEDAAVRLAAANVLAAVGPHAQASVTQLIRAAKDKEPDVRAAVARALGAIGPNAAPAVAVLTADLKDTDSAVRLNAAEALGAIGPLAAPSVPALGDLLRDRREPSLMRRAAAAAVARIGAGVVGPHIEILADALADPDNAIRLTAARGLAQVGQPAIPALVKALTSDSPLKRRFGAFALAKMGEKARGAAEPLLAALNDKNDLVRRNAAEALGCISAKEAVGTLRRLLSDSSAIVAVAAAEALESLAGKDPQVAADLQAYHARTAKAGAVRPAALPDIDLDQHEIGGPLAGVKLPLFQGQNGEPAGYPGCVPELAAKAEAEAKAKDPNWERNPLNAPYTPVGQNPERQLYPGSVEHWRAYMFKYMPVRSGFDVQSQVKNWVAPNIPGADAAEQYASPVYWVPRWGWAVQTDRKLKPVPVIRCRPGTPVFKLDLGELNEGAYVLRIVGAAPTESLRYFREPVFVRLKVNDGIKGEESIYRKRIGYTDEFYSVAEVYFNAPEKRKYMAEIGLDTDSKHDILVHNISLDDVLAGTLRQPLKTRMTLHKPEAARAAPQPRRGRRPQFPDMLAEERLARDAWLWECFPRPNAQANRPYRIPQTIHQGVPEMSPAEITAKYGAWQDAMLIGPGREFRHAPDDTSVFLINKLTGNTYSIDDTRGNRPLPDPYPYKDNGCGLYYPSPKVVNEGWYWTPIGNAVTTLFWYYPSAVHKSVELWKSTGEENFARDAAIALARWSYAFPTLDTPTSYVDSVVARHGFVGRDARFRRRITTCGFYRWYTEYANEIVDDYDLLYDYILTHPDIAASVGRFVPWVKTPQDVIKLIDVYFVQATAKRILRYQYHTGETKIARLATLIGDTRVTDPWMEWLFTRTFVYPLPVAGLGDLMVTGCTREGTEYIASTMYAGGENAIPKALALETYIEAGGNPKFNLSDPARYPKPVSACYWMIQKHVAGLDFLRIGDVTGPDKFYGGAFGTLESGSRAGWKWTKDPRFAFILMHYFGQKSTPDPEWKAVEAAAAQVKRAPWLDQPSRVMPEWAAVLESGRQHDDHRFRRAVAVRAGMGWGHHHNDGLDLQVWEHGLPMTCDGGQRPSYSKPADRSTRMHNLVEVDGLGERDGEWLGHNWVRALSDTTGAQYTVLQATPPDNRQYVKLFRRQVALIDVDEGEGSQPLTPAQCAPNAKLPAGVVTPDSYVFDVFRVSGGKRHTYCFHGNLSDEVKTNAIAPVPFEKAPEKDQKYLGRMAGERVAGDAPEHFEATWLINRGQERGALKSNYDPKSPRKFTRLHVLGQKGARVLRGSLDCVKWGYQIPMAFIQRRGPDEDNPDTTGNLESVFTAVIEPYVGEPFITGIQELAVKNNETDAQRAVALAVTTKNGHTDLCFADGRPDKVRSAGDMKAAAEFAYISSDADGLRQATLTGGTLLRTPRVTLKPAVREYTGKVVKVDYLQKTLWIDSVWPTMASGQRVFEIGLADHWTSYTATAVRPEGNRTAITVLRGADCYLSRVKDIDQQKNIVYCSLGLSSNESRPTPGIDKHWVASNENMTKFWRAEYLGGDMAAARFGFQLNGKAAMADFGRAAGFRLWEYGVGDSVRQSTFVNLRRVKPGVYELTGDVDVEVTLPGGATRKVTAAELSRGKVTLQAK